MKRDRTAIWSRALPLMAIAITFALSACVKERLPQDDPSATKEYLDFALELTPPGTYTEPTKAMGTPQQNAINRADVLVFKANVLLYHKTGKVTDIDGVKKRVEVNLKTSQSETELFDIIVIANKPASFDLTSWVGKTKAELKTGFKVPIVGRWTGTEFVMYGEALQTLIKPVTNNFKIQMLRSLARLDVGVGVYNPVTDTWAGLADFKLTNVRVVNTRNKYAAIPSTTTQNESGIVKVDAPTVPTDAAAQGTDAATAISYTSADITASNYIASTIFIAEAPNTTNRVTLLIGGSYKGGATTYYRIDMAVPKVGAPESYDYLNILRNHLYRVTITGVTGAGFTNAQEALTSPPSNIITTLTPIAEGGSGGDILFDGNSYLMADVSRVVLSSNPDGVKSFNLFNVKAGFPSGTTAKVTGPGITTSIPLTNEVSQLISVVVPTTITSGEYVITVGRLIKKIKLLIPTIKKEAVDAHFDFLPYMDVASIEIVNPQPWITLSQNMIYKPSEQQSKTLSGNAQSKAYVHFDENIATSGAPRTAEVLITRTNGSSYLVLFTQRNLSGMVLGKFGGPKDDYGYTKQLAVEAIEEYSVRVYDDTSLGTSKSELQWGFNGVTTNVIDKVLGTAGTISLAKRTDSGIAKPYTIFNNYVARYCYDKNRDTNGNGVIDDSEVVWYLPAQNQLMSAWISHSAVTTPFSATNYWSATENSSSSSWTAYFVSGGTFTNTREYPSTVRCVREL